MLDISTDHFCRDLVPNGSSKVPILPEFSSPKTLPDIPELPKGGTSTQTLETGHHLCDGVPRWERTEDMYMIRANLHFLNGNVVLLSYLYEQFFQPLVNITSQNCLAVFGCPYQMILGSIDSVRRSSENHAAILRTPSHLGSRHRPHCPDRSFPPAASSGAS